MANLQMPNRMRARWLPASLMLGLLLTGCVSTKETTVDYPIPPAAILAMNSSGGDARIVLSNGESYTGQGLRVDSLTARWFSGVWSGAPIASVASVSVRDRVEEPVQVLKGIAYTAAVFGAVGLIDGLAEHRAGVPGFTLEVAGGGAALAAISYLYWWDRIWPATIRYSINAPRSAEETARRETDVKRVDVKLRKEIADLNAGLPKIRIEPMFLCGLGNTVSSNLDAATSFGLGGGAIIGLQIWENCELGIQLLLAQHSLQPKTSFGPANRFFFALSGTFFPYEHSGLFIRAGIGYGGYSSTYSGPIRTKFAYSYETANGAGPALNVGAGYDIHLSDAWSIRPHVQYSLMSIGTLRLDDETVIAKGKVSSFLALSLSVVFKGMM